VGREFGGLKSVLGSVPLRGRGAAPRTSPRVLGVVALGGSLGGLARYGIAVAIDITPGSFPWGTFWINISGSLGLGLVMALLLERFPPSRYLRPFVATGFLGAFTTYSTFAVETDLLVRNGYVGVGLAYSAVSLVGAFAAVWAGLALGRRVPIRRRQP
jgi:CrcB protein